MKKDVSHLRTGYVEENLIALFVGERFSNIKNGKFYLSVVDFVDIEDENSWGACVRDAIKVSIGYPYGFDDTLEELIPPAKEIELLGLSQTFPTKVLELTHNMIRDDCPECVVDVCDPCKADEGLCVGVGKEGDYIERVYFIKKLGRFEF